MGEDVPMRRPKEPTEKLGHRTRPLGWPQSLAGAATGFPDAVKAVTVSPEDFAGHKEAEALPRSST